MTETGRHQTDHRTFSRVAEGTETWEVNDRMVTLCTGDTLTIPPFTTYRRVGGPTDDAGSQT